MNVDIWKGYRDVLMPAKVGCSHANPGFHMSMTKPQDQDVFCERRHDSLLRVCDQQEETTEIDP